MKAQLTFNGQSVDVELTVEQLQQLGIKEQVTRKRWRAEKNNKYWYVDKDGVVEAYTETFCDIDNFLFASGNYFKTDEEALKALNYILTRQRVKDAIADLNGNWKVDWSDNGQTKWYLYFDIEKNIIESEATCFFHRGLEDWKYLSSIEVFDQLKSMFTEAELKLALFEIHE